MRIAELRKAAGLTQEALAQKCEITRGALSLYEIGARSVPAALLPAIAKALNCTIEDLYQE